MQDIFRLYPENVTMFKHVTGSIRSSLNSIVPFEYILTPEKIFPFQNKITSEIILGEQSENVVKQNFKTYLKNVFYSSHFDFYNSNKIIADTLSSIPFIYRNNEQEEEYSLGMHNFLAETVHFFLKNEKLITFSSKTENNWKSFDSSKTYYFDLALKKSPDLIMVEAFSGSNINFYNGYSQRIVSASLKPSMNGRYFGYPCAKSLKTGSIAGNIDGVISGSSFVNASLIHHDPAYRTLHSALF